MPPGGCRGRSPDAASVKGPRRRARGMRALAAGLVLAFLLLAGCSDKGGDRAGSDGTGTNAPPVAGSSGSASPPGGGSGPGAGATPTEAAITVSTTGAYPVNPGFDPTALSVPASSLVHVTFNNKDLLPVQHNWVVEKVGAQSDTIASGEQSTFDFTAPATPGDFAFFCSIGDHRDRGMEGILTVTA